MLCLVVRSSYGLNVCIPPKIYVAIFTPSVMVLGGEGLWEVFRSWGQSPHDWDWGFSEGHPTELACPLDHVRTQQEVGSLQPGRGPSPEPDYDGPWSWPSSVQNCEKFLWSATQFMVFYYIGTIGLRQVSLVAFDLGRFSVCLCILGRGPLWKTGWMSC